MKALLVAALAASALTVAGCAGTGNGIYDTLKFQAAGVNMGPNTGVTAGYIGGTLSRMPVVDKNGAPIVVKGSCGTNSGASNTPDTFSNMNSKSSAQANSVTPAASSGGVSSPQIANATGDVAATGGAALVASAGTTGNPADTLAALCNNQVVPSATGGSTVRQGVSPASSVSTAPSK